MGSRAAIYARVSTLAGQSPQMQLDVLREYALRRELDVVVELVDHGVSGARDHRPALDKLMTAARRREIDVVLVYRFDRFARSVRHLVPAIAVRAEGTLPEGSRSLTTDTSAGIRGCRCRSARGSSFESERGPWHHVRSVSCLRAPVL